MRKRIAFLLFFLLILFSHSYSDVTLGAYFEGGIQWLNSLNGSVITNSVWNPIPVGDNRYGKMDFKFSFLNLAGWNGYLQASANILPTDNPNYARFSGGGAHFSYRPKNINFSIIKNEDWTWLGQPFLKIYGDKDRDSKTVALVFEGSDLFIKGIHNKTHIYNASSDADYIGSRLDYNYKLGELMSGGIGMTGSLKRWRAMSNNYVSGLALDASANILISGANLYLGSEIARLDEPFRGPETNGSLAFLTGANDGYAWFAKGVLTIPTDFGNFSINSYIQFQAKNFDANDQFNGTGPNWYEEFYQFNYQFPLKAIDFSFQVKYGHPIYPGSVQLGNPDSPTQVLSNTNWSWGDHFWDYYNSEPTYGTGQFLEYYTKLTIQFKQGIRFITSYQYFESGNTKLWKDSIDDDYDNDALKLDLNFENEVGKIDLQYKIYRLTYPDPRYRIDAGGLELVANITRGLKYYSRLLLVNSGGGVEGATSGSTSWWNYFGQIQYNPIPNLSIFLEYGNGGDNEWLTDNQAGTRSGKELERKLQLRFNYSI